ncbi:MAG: hypothetical protein IPJ15_01280 [Actinomycetales bacterium]|nr:hypothetical protein [Candidatus Phosphoribacter baldrii]
MSTRGTSQGRWAGVAIAGVILLSVVSIGVHALLVPVLLARGGTTASRTPTPTLPAAPSAGSTNRAPATASPSTGALVPIDGLGAPRPCDEQLWTLVRTTAPTLLGHLEELLIFDADPDPDAGDFVIEGESAPKEIAPDTFDDDRWRLSFAPNGLDRGELAWLVAHELAHIASLNKEQMLGGIGADVCATWHTGTGCLLRDSFLQRYLLNTWDDDLWDAWDEANAKSTEKARRTAYRDLYDDHKDSFVTSYAAWHPLEDFAESFAMWCTYPADEPARKKLPTAKLTDNGSKVAWFDNARRDLLPAFGPGCEMLRDFAAG